jgi:hypothetical protein
LPPEQIIIRSIVLILVSPMVIIVRIRDYPRRRRLQSSYIRPYRFLSKVYPCYFPLLPDTGPDAIAFRAANKSTFYGGASIPRLDLPKFFLGKDAHTIQSTRSQALKSVSKV